MSITMIAAMAKNRTIGTDNELPWRLPEDMAYFRRVTTGTTVIMGRKTLESFGKPLKNRRNVVLTRNPDYRPEGCEIVHSIDQALGQFASADVMVIGGEEIYRQFLPYADKILLTEIDAEFEGDAQFPEFSAEEWQLAESVKGIRDEKNPYDYYFQTYVKKRS
ncbi:dihydrofolate reductase [Paenibacillus abyssi]|uniref:Dihydrofolate reductase n=1 Tax=Paenibacillus abyssi TaxID=1340531 RepID=A0A917CL57_9BACL|nr:dihydrofolate reductase [Paenibacillus abyssi]GGF90038.1 dihydrofolate reductase [Paenibacillus abyssi]